MPRQELIAPNLEVLSPEQRVPFAVDWVRLPLKKRKFLMTYTETGGSVARACESVGIRRRDIIKVWTESDPSFAAAFETCSEMAKQALKDEAIRRAVEGVDEPVFFKGVPCGVIRRYSDSLLIKLLQANIPEFREHVEVSGSNGGPITVAMLDMVVVEGNGQLPR